MSLRSLVTGAVCVLVLGSLASTGVRASESLRFDAAPPSVVVRWNAAALEAVRLSRLGPPMVSRALAIAHTCMYDAWAAYDHRALGTRFGAALRRPLRERTLRNRHEAVSVAAHLALVDLFPAQRALFDELLVELGYGPDPASAAADSPADLGRRACTAVLEYRHQDGANQLGDENNGPPYSDYTGYVPVNTPQQVVGSRPLAADHVHQRPDAGLPRATLGARHPVRARERRRASSAPAGAASRRGLHPSGGGAAAFQRRLDRPAEDDLRVLGRRSGVPRRPRATGTSWRRSSPAAIAMAWKRTSSCSSRSTTRSSTRESLCGSASGSTTTCAPSPRSGSSSRASSCRRGAARSWARRPSTGRTGCHTSSATFLTPPFAEYPSGHSGFSAAAAEILRRFTGSDWFFHGVVLSPGSSRIEPGSTPERHVILFWPTFSAAADQAGLSRRYGGIHFLDGDLASRRLGRAGRGPRLAEVAAAVPSATVASNANRRRPAPRPIGGWPQNRRMRYFSSAVRGSPGGAHADRRDPLTFFEPRRRSAPTARRNRPRRRRSAGPRRGRRRAPSSGRDAAGSGSASA